MILLLKIIRKLAEEVRKLAEEVISVTKFIRRLAKEVIAGTKFSIWRIKLVLTPVSIHLTCIWEQ